jgi:hypothetical protein
METDPNAQLVLIWLLNYLRSEAKSVAQFQLRYVESTLSDADPKHLAN